MSRHGGRRSFHSLYVTGFLCLEAGGCRREDDLIFHMSDRCKRTRNTRHPLKLQEFKGGVDMLGVHNKIVVSSCCCLSLNANPNDL